VTRMPIGPVENQKLALNRLRSHRRGKPKFADGWLGVANVFLYWRNSSFLILSFLLWYSRLRSPSDSGEVGRLIFITICFEVIRPEGYLVTRYSVLVLEGPEIKARNDSVVDGVA
jgi:hypothetical protein